MHPQTLYILHIFSLFVLAGGTFYACAAPAETRKRTMSMTGVAALLMLVTGIGMMHRNHLPWTGWVFVKIACWLGLAAIGGIAYRRRGIAGILQIVAMVLALVAVFMVYTKPF